MHSLKLGPNSLIIPLYDDWHNSNKGSIKQNFFQSSTVFDIKTLTKKFQQSVVGTWNAMFDKIEKDTSFPKLIVCWEKMNDFEIQLSIKNKVLWFVRPFYVLWVSMHLILPTVLKAEADCNKYKMYTPNLKEKKTTSQYPSWAKFKLSFVKA